MIPGKTDDKDYDKTDKKQNEGHCQLVSPLKKTRKIHQKMTLSLQIDRIRQFETKWDWQELSHNHSITIDHVFAFRDKPWDWQKLSTLPCVTMEHV